jgi:hemolysin activation/secretion protein
MTRAKKLIQLVLVITLCSLPNLAAKEKPAEQFEQQRRAEAQAKREASEAAKARKRQQSQRAEQEAAKSRLPEDATARLTVRELRLKGNTLVSTAEILAGLPIVFNASDKPIDKADSANLYDFTALQEVIAEPGTPRVVSARTIQGLTQYILSVYQQKNLGGIYVYVPAEALKGGELKDGILQVDIIEASVSDVGIKYYDVNQSVVEKGRLDANAVLCWSPVKSGEVINRKRLDDYMNLLNLNPDVYVSAKVSKGAEANTLSVNYDIYEAKPWHYFIQADNSGVRERQWNPRIGVINTDLLGYDDSFFAMYQFKAESGIEDNYSLFGSYDIPIAGPKLRLNIFGGYSEFDLSPQATDIDFIGGGKFIGGNLRYNVFQTDGWFVDVIGTVSEEQSRITPSLFPEILGSNVRMHLWGYAVDIHKRDDIAITSLGYKNTASMGGSSRSEIEKARTGAERDFTIHTFYGSHSRVLDPNKVTRLSATLRWVVTNDRLPPAKMTPFGGMYSVRGYDEYEIVADAGVLASAQYEFDIIRYEKTKIASGEEADKEQKKQKGLKKLAPLVFSDFGRTSIINPQGMEESSETLFSVGIGTLVEYGDNFSGGVYCGFPLRETEDTPAGRARVSATVMMRW